MHFITYLLYFYSDIINTYHNMLYELWYKNELLILIILADRFPCMFTALTELFSWEKWTFRPWYLANESILNQDQNQMASLWIESPPPLHNSLQAKLKSWQPWFSLVCETRNRYHFSFYDTEGGLRAPLRWLIACKM